MQEQLKENAFFDIHFSFSEHLIKELFLLDIWERITAHILYSSVMLFGPELPIEQLSHHSQGHMPTNLKSKLADINRNMKNLDKMCISTSKQASLH